MTPAEQATAVRRGAGVFRLSSAGLFSVTGEDSTRWLGGMVSNDVQSLAEGPESSGCYAALLTPKGMIVADLHVMKRPHGYWVETAPEAIDEVLARLDRYIIADDVTLSRLGAEVARLGLEGPKAPAVLAAAVGTLPSLSPDCVADVQISEVRVSVARYGFAGEPAFQLFMPSGQADAVAAALLAEDPDCIEAGPEALEILRIEAGTPRWGAELADDVLPDEARLERAISVEKGCYTGQEIVARLRSRGQVNHLMVGLDFGDNAPEVGAVIQAGDRTTGEVTSVCESATAGRIGLGFVRRAHAEPGTEVQVAGQVATVVALPHVAGTAAAATGPT